LSTGLGLSIDIARAVEQNAPFDATISAAAKMDGNGEAVGGYGGLKLKSALKKKGVALDGFAKEIASARFYDSGETIPLSVKENKTETKVDIPAYIMKRSDYNDILKMAGKSPITLGKGEYAVNYSVTSIALKDAMNAYIKESKSVTLNGAELRTSPERLLANTLETLKNRDYNAALIVDDALVKGLRPVRDVFNINYPERTAEYEKLSRDAVTALAKGADMTVAIQTATEIREISNSTTIIVSYLAVYLGVIFLIAAAAVLAIGQLSEVSDNIGRYSLLRKIGAEARMVRRAIFTQNLVYFGAPMLLAAVHAVVGVTVVSRLVSALDKGEIARTSLFVAAVFLVVYGGYFLATYHGSKGILNRESIQRAG
jgi:putative ABC transport system permease protein